jgi:hypothetical protein
MSDLPAVLQQKRLRSSSTRKTKWLCQLWFDEKFYEQLREQAKKELVPVTVFCRRAILRDLNRARHRQL